MIDGLLAAFAVLMVPFAVVSTVILFYAARQVPRVGALTERTFIGADICLMLLSGAGLTINRFTGYALFPLDVARGIFSVSLILLGLVPIWWVILWYQGRLG
jgi:hypothetical protein